MQWQLFQCDAKLYRKEIAKKDEAEDALPGTRGLREERALVRFRHRGTAKGKEGVYVLPVRPQAGAG